MFMYIFHIQFLILIQGINVQQRVPQLLSLLDECNIDNILQFFEDSK